jgi:hypothetical protein
VAWYSTKSTLSSEEQKVLSGMAEVSNDSSIGYAFSEF